VLCLIFGMKLAYQLVEISEDRWAKNQGDLTLA
jgi:hypothetical protein